MVKRGIETSKVRAAVEAAERATSAAIVVSIAPWFWGDVEACAWRAFDRLGLARTSEHNGVLVFVVPSRRRFAVLGDPAIHATMGQTFWEATVAAIAEHFRARDLTSGIVHGVETLAAQLATQFPVKRADHGAS